MFPEKPSRHQTTYKKVNDANMAFSSPAKSLNFVEIIAKCVDKVFDMKLMTNFFYKTTAVSKISFMLVIWHRV